MMDDPKVLPDGKTCGDCAFHARCRQAGIKVNGSETVCLLSPPQWLFWDGGGYGVAAPAVVEALR